MNFAKFFTIKKISAGIAVLLLVGMFIARPVVYAAYGDDDYGSCTVSADCPSGGTGTGGGANNSGGDQEKALNKADSIFDRITAPARSAVGAVENAVGDLPGGVQKALPYYLWAILGLLAVILFIQSFVDRNRVLKLEAFTNKLRETLDEQKKFIHVVVHNLNTPLTVTKTSIELLEMTKDIEAMALAELKPASIELAGTIDVALHSINESPAAEAPADTASSKPSLKNTFMHWYFIVPVIIAVLLVVLINFIQLRIGTDLPNFYIFYQVIVGVVIIGVFANAMRLSRLSRQQKNLLNQVKTATEQLAQSRTQIISHLARSLTQNLDHLHEGIRHIKNKKVALMMTSGQETLLTIAKKADIASQAQPTTPEQVSVSTIINQILDQKRAAISAKQIQVQTNFKNDVPIKTFGGELITAVEAVIDNAVRYNNIQGSLAVSSDIAKGLAVVSVQDSGPGMDEQLQDGNFKPFSKSENELTGDQEALGLSLYVAQTTITRAGGSLAVESKAGQGTKITISLPASTV